MDAATAQRAIEIAFPTLRVATCRYLSEGWDSSAWEVNDSLVFRFPKRAAAVGGDGLVIFVLEGHFRVFITMAGRRRNAPKTIENPTLAPWTGRA